MASGIKRKLKKEYDWTIGGESTNLKDKNHQNVGT
jgi:hypothetical protein